MEKQFFIPMTETEFESFLTAAVTEVINKVLPGTMSPGFHSNLEEDLILFEEALSLLKCSGPTLYKFTRQGLESYKIGNKRFFKKSEVIAFITKTENKNNNRQEFRVRRVY